MCQLVDAQLWLPLLFAADQLVGATQAWDAEPAEPAEPAVHDAPVVSNCLPCQTMYPEPAVHAASVVSNCLPCQAMYAGHAGKRQCSSCALQAVHALLGLAGQTQSAQLALHTLQKAAAAKAAAAALTDQATQAALPLHRQAFALQHFSGRLVLASQWYLPPHSAGACGYLSSRLPLHQPAEQQHSKPNI